MRLRACGQDGADVGLRRPGSLIYSAGGGQTERRDPVHPSPAADKSNGLVTVATAAAAAATTAATVTAATTVATAAGTLFTRTGHVDRDRASADVLAVQRVDRLLGFVGCGHGH